MDTHDKQNTLALMGQTRPPVAEGHWPTPDDLARERDEMAEEALKRAEAHEEARRHVYLWRDTLEASLRVAHSPLPGMEHALRVVQNLLVHADMVVRALGELKRLEGESGEGGVS